MFVVKRQLLSIRHRSFPSTRRTLSSLPTNVERFYIEVSVQRCEDAPKKKLLKPPPRHLRATSDSFTPDSWYTVTLDGRPLKTPAGRLLQLPSEPFAYGIAAEWNAVEHKVSPTSMPLMVTACTAIDHASIQIEECMRFLQTDSICYWADPTSDRVLYRQQQLAWETLHQWVHQDFLQDTTVAQVYGTAESMVFLKKGSTTGLPHAPDLVRDCRTWLSNLDPWHATIAQLVMRETKSFLLGAALVGRAASAKAIQKACRVEEEFQIESWGMVEGQHDYDRLNASIQLHAASFATECLYHETTR